MTESVRAESRDRAPGTQIGIACELRWKLGDGPLTDGAAACEYTMRFVRVPELTAEPARQRDEPPGNPMVRYRPSSCQANITFDADGFVTLHQDYLERAGRGSSSWPVSTAERPGSSTGAAYAARCCAGPVSRARHVR